ncbi:MAG: response regulator [Nitrospirota bacterium]|nr:response regulator [Nitrospirota bacterium]MDH5587378.1 response regulator [Nitrospirota bacterium]
MSSSVKTILIADDDEDLRLLVQVTLENPTYRIFTAVDGRQALEAVNQHRPDLLIIDWMMPGLNGCEAVAQLRENPETATIPVVMLTAKDGLETKKETASLALVGYLAKPFSPLELIKKVRAVLEP